MKRGLLCLIIIGYGIAAIGQSLPVTTCVSINAGNDDIEEQPVSGIMFLTSSDLELVFDPGVSAGNQTVGLRFNNVDVPSGVVILDAYIQFTVDESDVGVTSLTIKGEDIDHSPPFTGANFNASTRTTTSASTSWQPNSWTTPGLAGADQQTPDLSGIVQEIIDRPGYAQMNSMSFIITGSGERTAVAFEGNASQAAQLCVTYQVPSVCNNTAPVASSTNITANSVLLSWTSIPDASGYRITGGVVGQGFIVLDVPAASSSLPVGALDPNTSFNWIVEAKCNASGSILSPASNVDVFTTLVGCAPPDSIYTTLVTSTSVRLNWTTVGGAIGYRITGNEVGAPGEVSLDIPGGATSFLDVPDLNPGASYFWKVQNYCSLSSISPATPIDVFMTLPPAAQQGGASQKMVQANGPFTFCRKITNSVSDVEEEPVNGVINFNSSDLELVNDPDILSGNQTVGLRFSNINIPQGAVVSDAFIQFTTDEIDSGFTFLIFTAEDEDNTTPFSGSVPYNVSNRSKTTATVTWEPMPWMQVGARTDTQKTPNIKSIIQEVVDRPGFAAGNSMTIFINGVGERTAASFESGSSIAPELCITYTNGCSSFDPIAITDNIDITSAEFSWTPVPNAMGYRIFGRIEGGDIVTVDVTNNDNPFTINQLIANRTYEWAMQAKCDADGNTLGSLSNANTFTTLPACDPPISIFTTDLTSNSVLLNWSPVPGAVGYAISGNVASAVTDLFIVLWGDTLQSKDIIGLNSSKTYRWKIQAICADSSFSLGTAYDFFTTASNKKESEELIVADQNQLEVYPNPASDHVYIDFGNVRSESASEVRMFSVLGELILEDYIDQPGLNHKIILPAGIPKGMYTLEVIVGEYKLLKKLIIH